jgi:hypothetical protein
VPAGEAEARLFGQPCFVKRTYVREGPEAVSRKSFFQTPGYPPQAVAQLTVVIPSPGVPGHPAGRGRQDTDRDAGGARRSAYRPSPGLNRTFRRAGIRLIAPVVTEGRYHDRPAPIDHPVRPVFR